MAVNSAWGLGLWASASLHLCSSSSTADGHLHQRHSLMESRISCEMHFPSPLHSDSSWAASTAEIHPREFYYLISGGFSADELHGSRFCPWSHSTNGSLLPQQIAWSCSLWSVAVAWRNICWSSNSQWSPQVPTIDIPWGKHWCLAASPLPSLK